MQHLLGLLGQVWWLHLTARRRHLAERHAVGVGVPAVRRRLLLHLLVGGLVHVDHVLSRVVFSGVRRRLVATARGAIALLVRCCRPRCLTHALLRTCGHLQLVAGSAAGPRRRRLLCRGRRRVLVRVRGCGRRLVRAAGAPHEYTAIHLIL